MYVYSLTYFLNAIGFRMDKKSANIINYMVIALLIFISGTRYYMGGSDVFIYENVYNDVPKISIILKYIFTGVNDGVNENYESGFLLICSIIKSLHFSYFGFILIFAILFYVLMYKGLKDFVPMWAPFWALFMYKIMFYDTFISIRQGLTMAVFCFSLKYIRDKKWLQYFVWCLIASMIHRGAIILFLVYFVQYIPLSKKTIAWTAAAFLPTWFIRNKVDLGGIIDKIISIIGFAEKSEGWADVTEPISIIHTLECYIMVLLVLFFYEKIISNEKQKEVKLVLQLFLLTIPIFTLLSNWIVMTREKDYFVMMYGIIFGYILDGEITASLNHDKVSGPLYEQYNSVSSNNAKIIALGIIAACFIGMARYVLAFNHAEFWNFTSFVTQHVSIFQ